MYKANCRRRGGGRREASGKAKLTTMGARFSPQSTPSAYGDTGRRQHPCAEDLVFAERFELGIGDRDDGQRAAQRIGHVGTVTFGVIGRDVVFHQLHDITAFQAVFRQVPGQRAILDRSTRRVARG